MSYIFPHSHIFANILELESGTCTAREIVGGGFGKGQIFKRKYISDFMYLFVKKERKKRKQVNVQILNNVNYLTLWYTLLMTCCQILFVFLTYELVENIPE